MRLRNQIGLELLAICCWLVVANAEDIAPKAALESATRQLQVILPSQPIEAALNEFARQSGLRVVIDSRIARGLNSTPVQGEFKTEEALALLLRGTGLTY